MDATAPTSRAGRLPRPGNWRDCLDVLRRCRPLGVTAGVTAVMMATNHDRLVPIARLAAEIVTIE
jgi:hypothetical protein